MIDAIKKAVLAGVGAAAVTTEKAEKVLSELVEKGKISAGDAKEAADKIAAEGKQEFEEASSKLQSKLDEVLTKMGKGNSERISALETKLAELERRLAEVEPEKAETEAANAE